MTPSVFVCTVGVVTTARSDYSIYRPILRKIIGDPLHFHLMIFVGGMHLSNRFGNTVQEIERDGFKSHIAQRVEIPLDSDSPEGMSKALGAAVIGFGEAFARSRPDILLVLGDRFEMFAAAQAALLLNIPIAHIHGGELTYGSIDDSFRHAITKLSHLHFVATAEYRERLIRMGEDPLHVTVSGAPALDEMQSLPPPNPAAFEKTHGVHLSPRLLLVTYHPATLELEQTTEQQVEELLAALGHVGMPVIFTQPNADAGGRLIQDRIEKYVKDHDNAWYVPNFGPRGYWDAMRLCAAMVGNSSSGIIEAPSFKVPVVNIGTRQGGRERAKNVIDVECLRVPIIKAMERAVSPEFRDSIKEVVNPYGSGRAAVVVLSKLKSLWCGNEPVVVRQKLLRKVFHDDGAAR